MPLLSRDLSKSAAESFREFRIPSRFQEVILAFTKKVQCNK